MQISRHPFWLVGFRPFFTFACLSGMSLPLVWALAFTGVIALPDSPLSPYQWHAHEMFYGFGWAVIGGFLLTASKNWVKIRGCHGTPLLLLALAWIIERIGVWYAGSLPPFLFIVVSNLFVGCTALFLLWTLVAHREKDDYKSDNGFFMVALPLFIIAKNLLLNAATFDAGWQMTLALFRLAFLLMLERTLTQFMANVYKVKILRSPPLDYSIKLLALALVATAALPANLVGAIELTLAAALLGRFFFWKPGLIIKRIDISVMYVGYLALVAQLLLDGGGHFFTLHWVGTLPVHIFTFGVMGLIIPAMITRIANGHTGRKVVFGFVDKFVLYLMMFAFALRIVAPQLWPEAYAAWVHAAAACWLVSFGLLGWRYIPQLTRPRIDGKEH